MSIMRSVNIYCTWLWNPKKILYFHGIPFKRHREKSPSCVTSFTEQIQGLYVTHFSKTELKSSCIQMDFSFWFSYVFPLRNSVLWGRKWQKPDVAEEIRITGVKVWGRMTLYNVWMNQCRNQCTNLRNQVVRHKFQTFLRVFCYETLW